MDAISSNDMIYILILLYVDLFLCFINPNDKLDTLLMRQRSSRLSEHIKAGSNMLSSPHLIRCDGGSKDILSTTKVTQTTQNVHVRTAINIFSAAV